MKRFKLKKLIALVLAVTMITLQSAPAFATEGSVSEGQETVGAETAEETPAASEDLTGEQTGTGENAGNPDGQKPAEETVPATPEEGTVPEGGEAAAPVDGDETVSGNEEAQPEEVAEQAEETVSEDILPEEEISDPKAVSEDSASGNLIEGYLTMITPEQENNAELLKEEIKELDTLEPGKDYVPNEATFLADTEEEAKKIAETYGAELTHFALGVASISWKDKTVDQAFEEIVKEVETVKKAEEKIAADENGALPLSLLKAADEALYSEVSDISVELLPGKLVEPNHISYIDTVKPEDDPLYGTSPTDISKQWFHASVSSANAWAAGADGTGITVAVIDTGIDTSNTDLSGNHIQALYSSKSFKSGEDDNGHGTHCSGIVAALDNDLGGLGIAPEAKIISIKAGSARGSLTDADINEAIQMAINKKVDVISMSFGGSGTNSETEKLLKSATSKGIACIAAAGNDSTDRIHYPAGYSCTLSVGSYTKDEMLSSFSNWGDWVDVTAPGSDIYATMPDDESVYLRQQGAFKAPITDTCSYGRLNGTSMATPVVAGIAALVKQANKGYNAEQIKNAIKNYDPKKVYKYGNNVVYRGVNAFAALTASTAAPPDPDEAADERPAPPVTQPETATLELGVGPEINVAQGKSVPLGAVVLPATKTKIVYSVSGDSAISVTAKGAVKVAATAAVGSTALVTASCGLLTASTKVTVIAAPVAGDFTLTKSHEENLSVASGIGNNSVDITVTGGDPGTVYRFKVSNKNVALFSNQSTTISAKGGEKVTLFAAGNGKATVTAFATDGSGKKASVKVKCVTPVTRALIKVGGVPITGDIRMVAGGKLKLKAGAQGTKVSNVSGKVDYTWSGPSYVKSNGTVIPGEEAVGQSFEVTLTAVNNGVTKTQTVKVIVEGGNKIKKLGYLRTSGSRYKYVSLVDVSVDGKRYVSKGTKFTNLYTMPSLGGLEGPYGFTSTGRNPAGYSYSDNDGKYAVSVSGGKKTKILEYNEYGVKSFKLLKKGTYKVTYTALDGSGKKCVLRFRVK